MCAPGGSPPFGLGRLDDPGPPPLPLRALQRRRGVVPRLVRARSLPPAAPVPAIVDATPRGLMTRTRLLYVSAMYTAPAALTARAYGIFRPAAALPGSVVAVPPGVTVRMIALFVSAT